VLIVWKQIYVIELNTATVAIVYLLYFTR